MNGIVRTLAQSVVLDLATAGAGWLTAHGYAAANETQGIVGSICFLAMLAVNAGLRHQAKQGPST